MTDKDDFGALKELARTLIRNRCVNDGSGTGGEERNAETLTDFFAEAGLKAETVYGPGNRANLYLIGRERAGVPTYGLMGHTDVVPPGEARWSFPPFCGDIEDGYLRGRGAVDMLGQLAAMAAAVRTHMKSGGGKNVRFFAMAGFYLNDSGVGEAAVVCAEKGVARVRLTASGKCGHGSLPYKSDNAVSKIAASLAAVERELSYPVLSSGYEAFVDGLPLSDDLKMRLKDSETVDAAVEETAGISFGLAKYLHAASRLTVMPGVIGGGTKVNVVPDEAFADLDLRLPETMSRAELEENLNRLTPVLTGEVRWTLTEFTQGNRSPMNAAAVKEALKAARKVNPTIRFVPFVSAGVSDSRFWRRQGVPAYGFTVFASDITVDSYSRLLHGVDEKISVDSLESMYRFYRELLK